MENRQLPLVLNFDIEEGRIPLSIKIALGEQLVEIIGAGTKVPMEKVVEISNSVDNQESLTIFVLQGLSARKEANAPVGTYVVTGLPEAPAGTLSISLCIAITPSLGINLSAKDSKDDNYLIELKEPGKPLGQKAITGLSEEAERDELPEFDGTYDDAAFHKDAVLLEGLGEERAYVHTGFFVGWLLENGLLAESLLLRSEIHIAAFRAGQMSGPALYRQWGGKLSDTMLSEEGNAFTREYFDFESGPFLEDYGQALAPESDTMFAVEDSAENYATLSEILSKRFAEWQTKDQ